MNRLIVILPWLLPLAGCSAAASAERLGAAQNEAVIIVSAEVDLGCIPAGSEEQEIIEIANSSAAPLEIARWSTSCECLRISPTPLLLEGHAKIWLKLSANHADEPDFVGELAVEVTGFDREGDVVVRFSVEMSVVDPARLTAAIEP